MEVTCVNLFLEKFRTDKITILMIVRFVLTSFSMSIIYIICIYIKLCLMMLLKPKRHVCFLISILDVTAILFLIFCFVLLFPYFIFFLDCVIKCFSFLCICLVIAKLWIVLYFNDFCLSNLN